MAELSFWARGDSQTANNASLNSQGTSTTPTTEITFTSGTDGNLELDYNNGDFDPDTQVIVDGVTYNFTVEFSGNLPIANKLANVAGSDVQGTEITVIELETGQRYYFFTDGSGTFEIMDAMPNGAIPIDNLSTTGPVLICFVKGTMIATPIGEIAVETLQVGDLVLTETGEAKPIRWIGSRFVSRHEQLCHANLRPIRIPADAFGKGAPHSDLYLSRQHRIVLDDWQIEMNFGHSRVLVPAGHLSGDRASVLPPTEDITYYHIYFDDHEMVRSNGLLTESFQPGKTGIDSLENNVRAEFLSMFADDAINAATARDDALPSLRRHEALLLAG